MFWSQLVNLIQKHIKIIAKNKKELFDKNFSIKINTIFLHWGLSLQILLNNDTVITRKL